MNKKTLLIWGAILLIPTMIMLFNNLIAPSDNFTIVGQIISSDNKQAPLQGVEIYIRPFFDPLEQQMLVSNDEVEMSVMAVSDAEGNFTLDLGKNIAYSRYTLRLHDPNGIYQDGKRKVTLDIKSRKRKEDAGPIMIFPIVEQ